MYKLSNKKIIGQGCYSTCYLLEDDKVYKEFAEPISILNVDFFKNLLEHKNESFCMPIEFVTDNRKFYGYVMPKILGKTLSSCFCESNIIDMAKNSILLEKNIDNISQGKILMYDFHSGNIMYDRKKFTVIDLDGYRISDKYNVDEVTIKNREFHRIVISNLFIENLRNDKYKKLITERILPIKYSDIKVSDLIIELKIILDNIYKEDIKTMNDIKKITGR